MSKGNIYRLKNGKTPNSWALKQHEVGINVPGQGMKFINYFPGGETIFVDHETNKNRKVGKVVFEHNGHDATEIVVPVENILLNTYLQKHPWFNVHYEIFSEELSAEKQLEEFELKEKALMLVKETDDMKAQAIALAINGMQSFGWTANKAKAWLKEKAFTEPQLIVSKMEAHNYESKYLSAMAFYSHIIRENNQKTAVIWNDDNEGHILHLAKGENGIDKLGEFIAESTDESRLVIQEISKRLNGLRQDLYLKGKYQSATIDAATSEIIDKKDAEIERLRAALAKEKAEKIATEAPKEEAPKEEAPKEEAPKEEAPKEEVGPIKTPLEELQKAYVEKYKKDVPARFKNDEKWLTEQIQKN